jgi:hypothetical protein
MRVIFVGNPPLNPPPEWQQQMDKTKAEILSQLPSCSRISLKGKD